MALAQEEAKNQDQQNNEKSDSSAVSSMSIAPQFQQSQDPRIADLHLEVFEKAEEEAPPCGENCSDSLMRRISWINFWVCIDKSLNIESGKEASN